MERTLLTSQRSLRFFLSGLAGLPGSLHPTFGSRSASDFIHVTVILET